jgi:hypothetical protein
MKTKMEWMEYSRHHRTPTACTEVGTQTRVLRKTVQHWSQQVTSLHSSVLWPKALSEQNAHTGVVTWP